MKAKTFLIGLTAGVVGGTIAIILSTPQSGKEFRSNLKTNVATSKDMLDDVTEQIKHVKSAIINFTSEAKNNIPQIITELMDSIQTFQHDIEPEKNNLQQEIETLQNTISEIEKNLNKQEQIRE